MSLADDLRALLVKAVQRTPGDKLPGLLVAMMAEGIVEDRRETVRVDDLRALPAPKAKRGRRKLTCPVDGCKRPFATRFGGYCSDHRSTAGYKAWAKKKR